MIDASNRAREVLAKALPGDAWADLRTNILDGSCALHSDPENWIATAAFVAIAQAHAAGRAEAEGEMREIIEQRQSVYASKRDESDAIGPDYGNRHDFMSFAVEAHDWLLAAIPARITTPAGGENSRA